MWKPAGRKEKISYSEWVVTNSIATGMRGSDLQHGLCALIPVMNRIKVLNILSQMKMCSHGGRSMF